MISIAELCRSDDVANGITKQIQAFVDTKDTEGSLSMVSDVIHFGLLMTCNISISLKI